MRPGMDYGKRDETGDCRYDGCGMYGRIRASFLWRTGPDSNRSGMCGFRFSIYGRPLSAGLLRVGRFAGGGVFRIRAGRCYLLYNVRDCYSSCIRGFAMLRVGNRYFVDDQ